MTEQRIAELRRLGLIGMSEALDEIERLQAHLRAVLNLTVSDGVNKIVEVTTAAEKALTPNTKLRHGEENL